MACASPILSFAGTPGARLDTKGHWMVLPQKRPRKPPIQVTSLCKGQYRGPFLPLCLCLYWKLFLVSELLTVRKQVAPIDLSIQGHLLGCLCEYHYAGPFCSTSGTCLDAIIGALNIRPRLSECRELDRAPRVSDWLSAFIGSSFIEFTGSRRQL
jgi:hypothetical protein